MCKRSVAYLYLTIGNALDIQTRKIKYQFFVYNLQNYSHNDTLYLTNPKYLEK